MNLQLVEQITKKTNEEMNIPEFKAGDTLKSFRKKLKKVKKFRIQLFEGVCIARKR